MKEKRRFVRIPESAKIAYRISNDSKAGDFLTKDLSMGGIRFFLHEFVPKGTVLKIKLTIERTHFSFEALAKVIWVMDDSRSQRYEVGAEFLEMPTGATSYLIEYIKKSLKVSE